VAPASAAVDEIRPHQQQHEIGTLQFCLQPLQKRGEGHAAGAFAEMHGHDFDGEGEAAEEYHQREWCMGRRRPLRRLHPRRIASLRRAAL
jgi:hypothetical protein